MQTDESLYGHIDEDTLEQYAMRKVTGKKLSSVEEHLLVCQRCQSRLRDIETFISAFRGSVLSLETQPIDHTHYTDHGPVRLRVQASEKGGEWVALLSGQEIEHGGRFHTIYDANTFLMQSFRELFPEHHCTDQCGPTGGHVPDVA